MSIWGKIVSVIDRSPVMLTKLHTNPSKFFLGRPKKIRRVCMEFSEYNWATIDLRDNLPPNAHFWQVGLLDIVLSEYPDKFHNFTNFIFMTSSL